MAVLQKSANPRTLLERVLIGSVVVDFFICVVDDDVARGTAFPGLSDGEKGRSQEPDVVIGFQKQACKYLFPVKLLFQSAKQLVQADLAPPHDRTIFDDIQELTNRNGWRGMSVLKQAGRCKRVGNSNDIGLGDVRCPTDIPDRMPAVEIALQIEKFRPIARGLLKFEMLSSDHERDECFVGIRDDGAVRRRGLLKCSIRASGRNCNVTRRLKQPTPWRWRVCYRRF
jgi:hypothetical protein